MSNKINFFDNISLYATPELGNHLITKAYADASLGAYKALTVVSNPTLSFTESGQVFYLQLTSDSTISLSTSGYTFGTNEIVEFTLIIFTTGVTATFPNWIWHNDVVPDLSTGGWYVIRCTSLDSGSSWLAKLEGSYSFPAKYKWVTTLSDATNHNGTSLRDAVGAASSGDTILFAPGLEGTITLEQGEIAPLVKVTIDGGNKITVSGNDTSRIFNFDSVNSSVLKNLAFTDGYATNGGVVYASKSVTYTNCNFHDNFVTGQGGAVCATYEQTFNNCTFIDNAAGNATTSTGDGGAIWSSASLTLSGCTFTNNSMISTTNTYGGAISCATVTASDCVFSGNSSVGPEGWTNTQSGAGRGGAIGTGATSGDWILSRCSFINNTARSRGGAVSKEGAGTQTFTDCSFIGNSVTLGNGGAVNLGGDNYHPDVIFDGCVFDNNTASYASGNSGAGNLWKCASLDIHDCIFRNNTTTNVVPVLRLTGYSSHGAYTIKRCMFTGNVGNKANDGLIVLNGNVTGLTISDSVFTGNSYSSSATGTYHGCVRSPSANSFTLSNCTFTNNVNMQVFYNYGTSTVNVYNSVEFGNPHRSMNLTNGTMNLDHYMSDQTHASYRTIAYNSSLPLFESDGYTPATGSQVIDAGDDTLVTSTTDFNGEDRIQGYAVDLGAVEFLLPAIQGLSFSNNSPQSSPIIYQENTSYPVDELVEVEGVEQGDTVNYNVENFLYGGNDVPVIDTPGTYIVTVTVSRLGYRKSRSVSTVAIKKNTGTIQLVEGTIYAGDIGVVTASVSSDANGYLTCELDGETYTGTISNGTGAIELENIPAGTYPVTIVAHCTNYTDITTTDTISVIKRPGSLSITASDVDMGENITLSGFVPEDFDGIVSCIFEGTTYTASLSDGAFTMYIPTTTGGECALVVYATGSSKYNDVSESAIIEVTDNRSNSTLTLSASDVYVGQNLVINGVVSDAGDGGSGFVIPDAGGGGDGGEILLEDAGDPTPCDFDGTATCTFEGNTYTATITDGEFTLSLPTTTAGSVTINVTASGSSSFKETTQSVSAAVLAKVTPTLQLNASDVAVGSNIIINGTVPSDYDGTASCTFEGTTYTASASSGSFQLSIPTTEGGTMILTVSLAQTAKYTGASNTATVVVSTVIPLTLTLNTPSDIYVGDTATISGSVSPTGITNGVATIVIDSTTTYTETIDSTGAFSKQITGLAAGEHTIEVTVSGDGCVADSDTTSITVSKVTPTLSVKANNVTYGNDVVINITAPRDATGKCVANINGVGYMGNIFNGRCKIYIPELPVGSDYIAKVTYEGDDKYLPSATYKTTFSVNPSSSPT